MVRKNKLVKGISLALASLILASCGGQPPVPSGPQTTSRQQSTSQPTGLSTPEASQPTGLSTPEASQPTGLSTPPAASQAESQAESQPTGLSTPAATSEVSSVSESSQESIPEVSSAPAGDTMEITVTNAPDWITNDSCVIFAWAWGGTGPKKDGAWYSCVYGEGAKPTSFTFTVPSDNTGCLLARCAAGTETPSWDATSGAGTVYNKTKDLTFTAGTSSYASPTWQEKKNGNWVDCN